MPKLSIRDLDLHGKRAFIRVDFNVPLKNGVIGDDTRIRESLATIQYAIDHGAIVILASHLGRPKGKVAPEFSLRPVAERPAAQQGHAERRPARSAAALINISGGIGDFGALRGGCTNRADSGRQWRP